MPQISDVLLLENPDIPVLEITFESSFRQMADKIGQGFDKIYAFVAQEQIIPADVAYVSYHGWRNMYTAPITISIGISLTRPHPGGGEIKPGLIPAGRNVTCMFRGSFSEMQSMYDDMEEYAAKNGMEVTGDCYEMYYNSSEFEEEDYLTKAFFTIKS